MPRNTSTIHRSGRVLAILGLVGIVSEVVLYVWPDAVASSVFSNPFSARDFAIAQTFFFVHHAALTISLLGLASFAFRRRSWMGRVGAVLMVLGAATWTTAELLAIPHASEPADDVNAGLVGTTYGIGCSLVGLGAVALGLVLLRGGPKALATSVLVLGISEFVILTPGIISNNDLLQGLAVAWWMATFAAVGAALAAAGDALFPDVDHAEPIESLR